MLTQDYKTTLCNHTHWQAAQANALTKACQRVCLPNRTIDRKTDEKKEALGVSSVYVAIAGEVVNRCSVLLINIVLNGQISAFNLLLHIHTKR